MDNLLLVLYLLSFLLISTYSILNFKSKGLCLDTFFLFLIILYYLFVPINLLVFGSELYDPNSRKYLYPTLNYVSFESLFATLLFLSFYILGTKINFKKKLAYPLKVYTLMVGKVTIYKILCRTFTILSLLSLLIYINQFGGLLQAIILTQAVRSGYGYEMTDSPYLFVKEFIPLSLITIALYTWQKRETIIDNICFYTSWLVISFLYLFLTAGKAAILLLFMLIYFSIVIKNKKYYISIALLFILGAFVSLGILDELFIVIAKLTKEDEELGFGMILRRLISTILSGELGKGEYLTALDKSSNKYLETLGYLVHFQVSLNLSLHNNYHLLFVQDFLTALSEFVPDRLLGTDLDNLPTNVQMVNTALYRNTYPILPARTEASVPPGIITYTIYSFSLPGLICLSFLWGCFYQFIDRIFKKLIQVRNDFHGIYAFSVIILGFYPIAGIPSFVIGNKIFVIFFLFLLVSFKLRYVR
ncbi:MAG TPA: hypothetical protein DCF68_22775 [Cyanothece sp. UBA12306]|nr:hypothetical protein [Cyanothece sp. UBA12306]